MNKVDSLHGNQNSRTIPEIFLIDNQQHTLFSLTPLTYFQTQLKEIEKNRCALYSWLLQYYGKVTKSTFIDNKWNNHFVQTKHDVIMLCLLLEGHSQPFYTWRGVRVNIWGLRFYKTIIFWVCELQLMKNSIFGV